MKKIKIGKNKYNLCLSKTFLFDNSITDYVTIGVSKGVILKMLADNKITKEHLAKEIAKIYQCKTERFILNDFVDARKTISIEVIIAENKRR